MREGQPSWTALVIAYTVVMLGHSGCTFLPPGIVPIQMALLEAVSLPWKDYYFLLILRTPIGVAVSYYIRFWVSLFCKNSMECIAFRKSFVEQQVRQFLQKNKALKPQVLILGAGYDTLSLRLSRSYPDVNFWEIDHPATGDFKNSRIWNLNTSKGPLSMIGDKPKNLFHASVDLTQNNALSEALVCREDSFSTSCPSIIVAEGLLMYFKTQQVYNLFDEISKTVGPGSVAAFDTLATRYDADNKQRPDIGWTGPLVEAYLKRKGEPWLLGLDTKILRDFLAESKTWSLSSEVQSFGPANFAAVRMSGGVEQR